MSMELLFDRDAHAKERLAFVRTYAAWVKRTPNAEWSRQQAVLIDSFFTNARNMPLSRSGRLISPMPEMLSSRLNIDEINPQPSSLNLYCESCSSGLIFMHASIGCEQLAGRMLLETRVATMKAKMSPRKFPV